MSFLEEKEGFTTALPGIRFGDVRHSPTLPMLIDFKPGFCRIPASGGSRDLDW